MKRSVKRTLLLNEGDQRISVCSSPLYPPWTWAWQTSVSPKAKRKWKAEIFNLLATFQGWSSKIKDIQGRSPDGGKGRPIITERGHIIRLSVKRDPRKLKRLKFWKSAEFGEAYRASVARRLTKPSINWCIQPTYWVSKASKTFVFSSVYNPGSWSEPQGYRPAAPQSLTEKLIGRPLEQAALLGWNRSRCRAPWNKEQTNEEATSTVKVE